MTNDQLNMIPTIAWRNIWRSPIRSGVVMIAITLGLALGIFFMAFSWGMSEQRARNVVQTQTSHVQLHDSAYVEEPKMRYLLPEGPALLKQVAEQPEATALTPRMRVGGMLSSTKGGFGVQITGIVPEREAEVTRLDTRVIAGDYFASDKANRILIGEALAEKTGIQEKEGDSLRWNFRKRLVLTLQNIDGESVRASFRVGGVYHDANAKLEEVNVYVQLADFQRLAGVGDDFHEIAVVLQDIEQSDSVAQRLAAAYPALAVETWADLAPDLQLITESFEVSMFIFIGIILLALAFGIVNTMLMAVLERTKELGMLMAVGMNRSRVFRMIMLETLFLVAVGGPLGLLLGFSLVEVTAYTGLDLSQFSEGIEQFGFGTVVRPELSTPYYLQIALMVVIAALLSAVYPAWRALKLRPVEAVRTV